MLAGTPGKCTFSFAAYIFRFTRFCDINHYPEAVGSQCPDIVLGTNVKALNGKRGLVPRPVQIRHKHADLQIVYCNLPLLNTHMAPRHLKSLIATILTKYKKESITIW